MKTYVLTLAALLLLSALTLALSFVSLGAWQAPTAILIAVVKALLVALFFMHLAEQTTPARMAALVGVLMGVMLIVIATLDVATRPEHTLRGTDFPVLTPGIQQPGPFQATTPPPTELEPDTASPPTPTTRAPR